MKRSAHFLCLCNFGVSGGVQQPVSFSVLALGPAVVSRYNTDLDSGLLVGVVSRRVSRPSAVCKLLHFVQAVSGLFDMLESLQGGADDPGQNRRLTCGGQLRVATRPVSIISFVTVMY